MSTVDSALQRRSWTATATATIDVPTLAEPSA